MHDFKEGLIARGLARLRAWLGRRGDPPPSDEGRDPFAWRPVPRRPAPNARSAAAAVVEPDE
jgi:hypothetical protein